MFVFVCEREREALKPLRIGGVVPICMDSFKQVCVCERERKLEREREKMKEREREREREGECVCV